ncbi:MAG: BACON domain-containing protein [Alistipes sp.]|nr:BACON domain-containing protein [Alistipes sp.]
MPLFFVACEDPEQGVDKPVDKEYAAELTLTSEAEMNFDAAGGEGVITYTAKMVEVTREAAEPKVEATCEADWVTDLTVADNITFTVAANDADARETKVVVTYSDKSFEVAVKQAAKQNEEPEPEYVLDVELAGAARIPSDEVELSDNYFALAFADDAENIEVGIVLKGAEGETILKAGDYTSEAETLLVDACEVFVWEPAAQYTFAEGVVAVAVEGDIYTFDMEFADDKGNLYHFTYEGPVLAMEPAEKPQPEAFVPVKVEAYREAHWDLGNFELDLYINDELYHSLDMQDNVSPNDKYLSAGNYSYPDTITDWSNFVIDVETGEGAYFDAAEIELAHNEDGTSTIKGYIESEYGQRLNIDWTGVVAGFDFTTGGDTPQPGETVEFTATFFGGTYYGDGNYYIVISDAEVTGNNGVDGATYYYFDIYAGVETEDLSVPNGTYTFDPANSYATGTFTAEYGFGFITNDGVPTWYLYAEGSKLTVSDNKIVAELVLTDGAKHIVTYEGSLSLAGTGASGDIEVNATGWDAIVEYYGQYYNYDTDNYYVQLFEDAESGNGEYFVLDLLADYATCVDHSGTFTGAESMGINTFVAGYFDDGYLAGSWYAELEGGVATGVMAPLTEGTITVTLNGDGTQTYTFDCKDDIGNKITGSVTATPFSSGYALSKGAEQKSKSYKIELPKRVVR